MKKFLKFGFVGLTHLGLNYLAGATEKKFNVIGVDLDSNKINQLKKFKIQYSEPKLKKTIIKNQKNILFSSNLENLRKCNIVFISQDVETDIRGKSNFNDLKKLIKNTTKFLNKKAILVILSQVYPGFVRQINFDHSRLYYQVETLIIGQAMKRMLKPERFIIGCTRSDMRINTIFLNYLKKFKCPIIKMKYESAELTKISINILLSSSITISNILAEVCEKVSADWYEIIPALKLDQRIGKSAYIKPGLGISGGNLERDINNIKKIIKNKESLSIINNIKKNSLYMKSWVYRVLKVNKVLNSNSNYKIGILGLAYKTNTNSVKNSPTLYLLKKIKNKNCLVYDPQAKLSKKINNCSQVNDANFLIKNSNVIILMTPWPQFRSIIRNLKIKKNTILIDPHRIIDLKINKNYLKYFTIGKN